MITRLAIRYLRYHKIRTALLVLSVALVCLLPFAVTVLVGRHQQALSRRAVNTPLVVGAKGSRFDLLFNALYFRGRTPAPTNMAEYKRVRAKAPALPVLARHRAQGHPVVGVSPEYFAWRRLAVENGTRPALLGDCALGANVAQAAEKSVGDFILTDKENTLELTGTYPMKLFVAGVLAPTGGPDDDAIFVGLLTAWVLEGIGHGHAGKQKPGTILNRDGDVVVYNEKVQKFVEFTDQNRDSFHVHGTDEDYPLTAILVYPIDNRAATILKGRYRVSQTGQILDTREVVDELLGFVFQLKRFFDANTLLVTLATGLFLALIVALTLRVRKPELETLFRIGCARGTIVKMVAIELTIVIGAGIVVALCGSLACITWLGP